MKKILSIIMLLASFATAAMAQVKAGDVISGQVWDDFDPLMMCNVVEIDNTNRIVAHGVTDINGNFSFKIVSPKDKIRISYVGCQTLTLPITKRAFGKIVLKSSTQIQEVVIKAVKKTQSSGLQIPVTEISVASQSIDMKEFEGLAMTSVDEALQGRISGLDIVANSGNLGAGTTMRLRGVSTIKGNAEPLIVVNGNVFKPTREVEGGYESMNEEKFAELLSVNPEDIESITVLKDAASTVIWGTEGANGVIEIKTKRGARGKTHVDYSYRFTGSWQPQSYDLLNGPDYTMYLKEAYFNARQENSFTIPGNANYMPEIMYNDKFSEYHMYDDDTDWRKAVSQFGTNQQHFVSIQGGGEKANFRISGGYDHQTGIVIAQVLDRFTTRVALDYFVSDRIKIQSNFNLTYTKNQRNSDGLLSIASNKMPNLSIYEEEPNADGEWVDTDRYYTMNRYITAATGTYAAASGSNTEYSLLKDQYDMPNPVASAYLARNEQRNVSLSPEFILNYDILGTEAEQHKLTYQGQIVFNISSDDTDKYYPGSLVSGSWNGNNKYNSTGASYKKSHQISTRHSLTFTPHFNNQAHSLMVMARFQYTGGSSSSQSMDKKWLPTSEQITSPLAGGILTGLSTGASEYKSERFIVQAHYAYKGKYILDATVTCDGKTSFGPERRWGRFPGLSGRWNISDEPWMKRFKWIDMISIAPGWGIVGNDPGGQNYLSYYRAGSNAYMGQTTFSPSNIRLGGLRWEEQETFNLSSYFGFFHGRIDGDVALYHKTTRDLLMPGFVIPSSSGYSTLSNRNAGVMRNVGWEFNINGHDVIKAGKFAMDLNITFANNRNRLLEMDEVQLKNESDEFDYKNGQYLKRVQLNAPLGAIYGFRCLGVYQYTDYSAEEIPGVSGPDAPVVRNANGEVVVDAQGKAKRMYFDYGSDQKLGNHVLFVGGDAKYEDVNHDGSIDELDIVYLGSSLPTLTGGFGFKFRYDGWQLNCQFNYRVGYKCVNLGRMGIENMSNNNNMSKSVNWRWHAEGDKYGDNCYLPRAVTTQTNRKIYNYLGSDRFVEDASFLRLNYMQLSYNIKQNVLKSWGIKGLRLNGTLNNLFCITKYSGADPEHPQGGTSFASDNTTTPRSRSFTVGASVSF